MRMYDKEQQTFTAHRRLPSISELILSFPPSPSDASRSNVISARAKALPSTSHSVKRRIPSEPNLYEPQRNYVFPPRTQNGLESLHTPARASVRTEHSRSSSMGFHSSATSGGSLHHRSNSLSDVNVLKNADFGLLEEEENLLSSLSKVLNNLVFTCMERIKEKYLDLVDNSPTEPPMNTTVLRGYVSSSNSVKYITEHLLKEFIVTSPQIDLRDFVCEVEEFHKALLILQRLQTRYRKLSLANSDSPGLASQTSPFGTSQSLPSKKRKKNFSLDSSISSSSQISGGNLIPIDVKALVASSNNLSSNTEFRFGALNTDLSKKPDISCNHCGSKDTPEWRKGKDGSKTLCNACGLFYSKLAKRYGPDEAVQIMSERKEKGLVTNRRIK